MGLTVAMAPHPLLDAGAFVARFAHPLAELVTPSTIAAFVEPNVKSTAVLVRYRACAEVRQLLRTVDSASG